MTGILAAAGPGIGLADVPAEGSEITQLPATILALHGLRPTSTGRRSRRSRAGTTRDAVVARATAGSEGLRLLRRGRGQDDREASRPRL